MIKEESVDYFMQENETIKQLFNLDEILDFQLKHDIQIIRGEDYMYLCYIGGEGFGDSLTPLHALCVGIKQYKEYYSLRQAENYEGSC